jgi:LPS sulfotransferase NodH
MEGKFRGFSMDMFVVLTRGRTGSTPLVEDLDQHPDIVCHHELFRPSPVTSRLDLAPYYEAVKQSGRTLSAEEYLRETATTAAPAKMGFKALLMDLQHREGIGLERFLLDSRMPIVHLTRDPVRSAISAGIAKERGAYNHHKDTVNPLYLERLKQRVTLDPAYVVDEARYYDYWAKKWRTHLLEVGSPHIEVTYEEYVSDRVVLLNRIFRFLDVAEMEELPNNPYSKVTSEDVWSHVINADEVRDALASLD